MLGAAEIASSVLTRALGELHSTWFIPGHSLDTFPEQCAAVRDAGHEIGLVSISKGVCQRLVTDFWPGLL